MKKFLKIINSIVLCSFVVTIITPYSYASEITLPPPNQMLNPGHTFTPVIIKGMVFHQDDPFKFDFLMDTGTRKPTGGLLRQEAENSIKYFLASLTVADNDQWVNLSPEEKNRIIPETFGKTVMGRDLLGEDYVLKQLASSLLYPENELGKEFWAKVYAAAAEKYGKADIDVGNFNRVWITPAEAQVWENDGKVVILKSCLKVMLETDYLALKSATAQPVSKGGDAQEFSNKIMREILVPALEKEVNEGEHFARLRQIYAAMILSAWYKERLKESLLAKTYADKGKVRGIEFFDGQDKEQIYNQYLEAVKKGVYNYIKEDVDLRTGEMIPRKYFSGGFQKGNFFRNLFLAGTFVVVGPLIALPPASQALAQQASQSKGNMVLVASGVQDVNEKDLLKETDEMIRQLIIRIENENSNDQYNFLEGLRLIQTTNILGDQVISVIKNTDIYLVSTTQGNAILSPGLKLIDAFLQGAMPGMAGVVLTPVNLLAAFPDFPGVRATLIALLSHKNYAVQTAAALALKKMPDRRIVPMLLDLLESKKPSVRLAAILALGPERAEDMTGFLTNFEYAGDHRIYPALKEIYSSGASEDERIAIIDTFGKLGDNRAIFFLISLLNNTKDDLKRTLIKQSLDSLGVVEKLNNWGFFINDGEKNQVGRYLIAQINGHKISPADKYRKYVIDSGRFSTKIKMVFEDNRILSMRALVKMGYLKSIDVFLGKLNDADPEIVEEAIDSLIGFGVQEKKVFLSLRHLANNTGNVLIKRKAFLALLKLGDKEVYNYIFHKLYLSSLTKEDLKISELRQELLSKDKDHVLIMNQLGWTAASVKAASVDVLCEGLKEIKILKYLYKSVDANLYKLLMDKESQAILQRAQRDDPAIADSEYIQLNTALLRAMFQRGIRGRDYYDPLNTGLVHERALFASVFLEKVEPYQDEIYVKNWKSQANEQGAVGPTLWQLLAEDELMWRVKFEKQDFDQQREAVRASEYLKDKSSAIKFLLQIVNDKGSAFYGSVDYLAELGLVFDKIGQPRFKKILNKVMNTLIMENIPFQSFHTNEMFYKVMYSISLGKDVDVIVKYSGDEKQLFLSIEDPAIKDKAMVVNDNAEVLMNEINTKDDVNDLGGINMDRSNLDLQIKRDGNGVALPVSQQDWTQIDIQGFTPIIYRIEPVNMGLLLGLNANGDLPAISQSEITQNVLM